METTRDAGDADETGEICETGETGETGGTGQAGGGREATAPRAARRGGGAKDRRRRRGTPAGAVRKQHSAAVRKASGKRWSKAAERAFLTHLSSTGNVQASARAADFSTNALYNRRKADPAFAAAWKSALADGYAVLEAELLRRAIEGIEKPVYRGDVAIGSVRNYPDAMAMRLLLAHRAETAAERTALAAQVRDDGASREQFRAMLKDIRDRLLADQMAPIGDVLIEQDDEAIGDDRGAPGGEAGAAGGVRT
jgi:hypothetical protein